MTPMDIDGLMDARGVVAAKGFLGFFGGEDALLVVIDPMDKKKPVIGVRGKDALAKAEKLNKQQRGVYYSVNRPRAGVVKKAAKADIVGVRAVGYDYDYPGGEPVQAQAELDAKRAELEAGPLPPTVILSSGGGIQALWLLDEELPATPENIAIVEGIGKAVRARHGGDDISNIDRVLRLPGFINWPKPEKAARGQKEGEAIVLGGSGTMYALDGLLAAFPPAPAQPKTVTPGVGAAGRPTGSSDDLGAGIEDPPVDVDEVRSAALWMARHPSNPFARGNGNYTAWRDHILFPLAEITVQQPDLEPRCRALLDELVGLVGREAEDNWKRFDKALRSTAARLAAGEDLRGRGTLFGAAQALGWTVIASGAAQDASQAGAEEPAALGTAQASTASSGPRWGTPGGASGPVNVFNPPLNVPMPLGALPEGLRNYIGAQARSLGCDRSALGLAVLTVSAAAIDARTQVRLSAGGWKQRPIVWSLLIGDPSSMKTPVIDAATRPLLDLDNDANFRLEAERRTWRAAKAAKTVPLPPRPELPAQFTIQDVTHQKACEILSRKPRGSLMVRDEISGLFVSCMRETDDRSFWLKSYDALMPHRKQKQGDGRDDVESDIFVEVPALSMLGGIQPKRLEDFPLAEDGLLQRFIPIKLSPATEQDFDADTTSTDAHYDRLVRTIANRGSYGEVRLSTGAGAARTEMMNYLRSLEKTANEDASDATLGSALGKVRGLWGRLALVLHIVEFEDALLASPPQGAAPAFPQEISEETANRASDLTGWVVRTLFVHYFTSGGFAKEVKAIARTILVNGLQRVRPRDLMRSVNALKGTSSKEVAEMMSRLETAGWIEPIPPPKGVQAPREWDVDPAVHSLFADIAKQEKERIGSFVEHLRDSFAERRRMKSAAASR